MNRQILFRGKRLDNDKWVYGDLEYNRAKNIARIHTYDEGGEYLMQHLVEPDTVGQFTGITDESGKEVYQGDILEACYKYDKIGYNGGVDPDNDCICYGAVEFDNNTLQWCLNVSEAEYPIKQQIEEDDYSLVPLCIFGHEYGYNNCNINVLGNRFDTPDLLNGK